MPRVLNKKQAIAIREQGKPYLDTCQQVKYEIGDHPYWRVKTGYRKANDWQIQNSHLYLVLLDMNTLLGSYLHGTERARKHWPHLFTKRYVENVLADDLEQMHNECVGVNIVMGSQAHWRIPRRRWSLNNDDLGELLLNLTEIAGRFAASPTMMDA